MSDDDLYPTPNRTWAYEIMAPAVITCIDCGGRAHLLSRWDRDQPPQAGDLTTYRCADCLDRWDLIIPDEPE